MQQPDRESLPEGVTLPKAGCDGNLVTIVDLVNEHDPNAIGSDSSRIADLETDLLRRLLPSAVSKGSRVIAFLVSQELTRRGIPPCFRGLSPADDDDPEQVADRVAFDLEWIAGRYPRHKTFSRRWSALTNACEKKRMSTIRFICNWRSREWHRYVKMLALTVEQQWECQYLRLDRIANKYSQIVHSRKTTRDQLARRRYDRNLTLIEDKDRSDFERWVDVWECAEMGNWKRPTRVAWLYEAKTGKPLTRQMAANIMGKLCRDLRIG